MSEYRLRSIAFRSLRPQPPQEARTASIYTDAGGKEYAAFRNPENNGHFVGGFYYSKYHVDNVLLVRLPDGMPFNYVMERGEFYEIAETLFIRAKGVSCK
jgi:hypothetical protein